MVSRHRLATDRFTECAGPAQGGTLGTYSALIARLLRLSYVLHALWRCSRTTRSQPSGERATALRRWTGVPDSRVGREFERWCHRTLAQRLRL